MDIENQPNNEEKIKQQKIKEKRLINQLRWLVLKRKFVMKWNQMYDYVVKGYHLVNVQVG